MNNEGMTREQALEVLDTVVEWAIRYHDKNWSDGWGALGLDVTPDQICEAVGVVEQEGGKS